MVMVPRMRKHMQRLRLALFLSASVFAATAASAQTLDDALVSAYQKNPTLAAERKNHAANEERISQAISGFRPDIAATYSKSRTTTQVGAAPEETTYPRALGLSVVQPIFSGGETVFNVKSAKYRVGSSAESLRDIEQSVLLDAITAYLNVVKDQAVLELSQKNSEVLGTQLEYTQTRFDVGELTKTDVAQAEARLSAAKADVATAQGNLESSRANFERVTLMRPGNLAKPNTLPVIPTSLDEALERADANNPKLKSAEQLEVSANYDAKASVSRLLPEVEVVGRINDQEGLSAFRGSELEERAVALEVTVPLYQTGAEYSRIRQARRIHEARKFDVNANRNQVREDVIRAWERLQSAASSIEAYQDAVGAAETALEGVKLEADVGSRTTLDVLDAERELFQSRVNLTIAERDRAVAMYTLLAAVGDLTADKLGIQTALSEDGNETAGTRVPVTTTTTTTTTPVTTTKTTTKTVVPASPTVPVEAAAPSRAELTPAVDRSPGIPASEGIIPPAPVTIPSAAQ